MTPLQKMPKNVGDLGKFIVAKGFKKLPKVQKIAQSGHTGCRIFAQTQCLAGQLRTYLHCENVFKVIFLVVVWILLLDDNYLPLKRKLNENVSGGIFTQSWSNVPTQEST